MYTLNAFISKNIRYIPTPSISRDTIVAIIDIPLGSAFTIISMLMHPLTIELNYICCTSVY